MDAIIVSEPQTAVVLCLAEPFAAEVFSSENPIEPLNLIDRPKVRTALRLYAILSALYVSYLTLCEVIGKDHLTNNTL